MRRAVGILAAIGVSVCLLAGCKGNAHPIPSVSSREAVGLTKTSFAALYGALNDATIDAYLVDGLLHPTPSGGTGEPCMKTDNSVASRPSVLANPPLAESSIAQRSRLIQALAAYDVAIASQVDNESHVGASIAISDLQRVAFALNAAANAHAQGDLFIEDPASRLAAAATKLLGARSRGDVKRIVLKANPIIVKLGNVLAVDVAQRHTEASNASRLDYERWLAYYIAIRRASSANHLTPQNTTAPIPRCFASDVPPNDGAPITDDMTNDGARFAGRDAILARLQTARDRYNALRNADPTLVLASLSNLNDSVIHVVDSPGDARATAALQNALARFRSAAQTLATALWSLERGGF